MIRLLSILAVGLGLSLPATAQNLDDIVRLDVLDGGTTAHGTQRVAIRLSMADGWKTYWRAPGDAGIPPRFTWKGSRNLGAVAMSWPTPKVFDQNGMRSIGYDRELVLPIEVTPQASGRAVRLKGKMDIGICEDICIPATLSFDHRTDPTAGSNPVIAAALANRPFSEQEAGVTAATCHITPTSNGLRIEAHIAMPPAGGKEVAVIEPGDPHIWSSEARATRHGGTLVAASDLIHVDHTPFALDRSALRITVLGQKHAVDIRGCTSE
ncbi:protein-disulfide reductase DsbD domain-containing protein [Thalassococcus sp. S3]|uniref:protein-disulfide reductase DsbD domain-containing protein n=1 Tax=Thalassococcus sp. S3 TaxID=2017482 RepID=UPI0010248237|nr:protein-disulfide reductase DsbD domain-containing protein [Thalassococcus sp. S3]QBF33545.1 hypothetical protein CFI11_20355 [Thalassococcus sp. S3]